MYVILADEMSAQQLLDRGIKDITLLDVTDPAFHDLLKKAVDSGEEYAMVVPARVAIFFSCNDNKAVSVARTTTNGFGGIDALFGTILRRL